MGVIDNVKEVANLVKELGNIELYRQILDLQGEIMELTQFNRDLQEKNDQLQSTIKTSNLMSFKTPFYYVEGDDVPHCPRCWEADQKAIHYPPPFQSAGGDIHTCPECKHQITHPRRRP